MSLPFAPDRVPSPLWMRLAIALCATIPLALPAVARTRPHYGGTMRIAVQGDPLQPPSGLARKLVLDGLTRLDNRGNAIPSLAERWSAENNDHRWQFRLRSGVSFHDGKPLTAIAVAASLSESCRVAPCPWSGLHAVGASLIVTSDLPIPELPTLLAEDRFRIQAIAADDAGSSHLIGTGPFRIGFPRPNGAVILQANEDCWEGRPFLDSIELTPRQSGRDASMDWNADAGSRGMDMVALRPGEVRQASQRRLMLATQPAVSLLALQIREESLNPQLRAALALAIDRLAIYQGIFQRQGEVTASLLPAAVSGYSFLFPTERDLARAQAERGGLTPPPLTIATEDEESMQLAAARVALNLHDAGFNVRLLPPLRNDNHDGRIANADLTLRLIPLSSGQPQLALDSMLRTWGQNVSAPANDPTGDYKIERDFLDQHILIPILYLPQVWTVSIRVRDLQLTFDGSPDLANVSLNTNAEYAP